MLGETEEEHGIHGGGDGLGVEATAAAAGLAETRELPGWDRPYPESPAQRRPGRRAPPRLGVRATPWHRCFLQKLLHFGSVEGQTRGTDSSFGNNMRKYVSRWPSISRMSRHSRSIRHDHFGNNMRKYYVSRWPLRTPRTSRIWGHERTCPTGGSTTCIRTSFR